MKKIIFIIMIIVMSSIQAADGDLDLSFNGTGKAFIAISGSSIAGNAVVLQPDGKIIVGGQNNSDGFNFVMSRFNSDGSVDSLFGTSGIVVTSMNGAANAVLLQPDGKIILIGAASNNSFFAVARYLPNGSLDPSFGNGGIVTTDLGTNPEQPVAGVLQPDGKIIAGGLTNAGGTDFNFGLTRYHSNGSLDTSFGNNGIVRTDFGTNTSNQLFALILQPDGKIIGVGRATVASNFDFGLARYNTNGSLDTTFGTGGLVTTNFGGTAFDQPNGVALQPADGKIVVAGRTNVSGVNDFALARYNTNGSLDTTFGTGGLVTTDFGGDDQGRAVVLQSDGRIIVIGFSTINGTSMFSLVRYHENGSTDSSFGTNGVVKTSFGSTTNQANAISIQADGKLVVAGNANPAGNGFAVARYLIPSIAISLLAQNIRDKYLLNTSQNKGIF